MSSLHKYLRFTFAIWVTLLQLLVPTTTFAQSLRQEPVEWDGMRQPVSATILPQAAPTNIKKIVAGKGDSCLLTEGGSVYCWGNTPNSSSGRIASKGSDVPTLKQGVPSGVKDIVMGDSHACLLLNDGTVKCWGSNYYGQLGKPAIKPYNESIVPTDTLPFAGKVIAIAAGANHSCALLESGAVQCWGANSRFGFGSDAGALGVPGTTSIYTPTQVTGLTSSVVAIAAGETHSCAVKMDGSAWCWGGNSYGQLGDGTATSRFAPAPVSGLSSGVAEIAAYRHTCALLTNGGMKCWGWGLDGQLGDGATEFRRTPVDVIGLSSGVAEMSLGLHSCVRLTNGTAKCWGQGDGGKLGSGTISNSKVPTDVIGLSNVTSIAASKLPTIAHSCAIVGSNRVKCWGSNYYGELGTGEASYHLLPQTVQGLSGVTSLAAGEDHLCAIVSPGEVRCIGSNHQQQLGEDGGEYKLSPIKLRLPDAFNPNLSGVTKIFANFWETCALRSDAITCWGAFVAPVDLLTETPSTIALADAHRCVLIDGAAKCSGTNSSGQLGNGTTNFSSDWVDVTGLNSGVSKIAVGGSTSCAIQGSGALLCWGLNNMGQVGDGTTANKLTPTAVVGLGSGVVDVATENVSTCAVLSNGGVRCWGGNNYGQLGVSNNGNISFFTTPVAVEGVTNAVSIAMGANHACVVTTAGGVKCWGSGTGLGTGITKKSKAADVIGLSSGVRQLLIADYILTTKSCALMTDGTVKCWGNHYWGEFGDGRIGFRTTPVDVLFDGLGVQGGVIRSPDNNTIFTFSSDSFAEPIGISYTIPSTVPPLDTLKSINRVYDAIPYLLSNGQSVQPFTPYKVSINYRDADLNGIDESTLGLYFFDGTKWVLEPTSTVNAVANTVAAQPDHFSTWAVLSDPQAASAKRVYLPLVIR